MADRLVEDDVAFVETLVPEDVTDTDVVFKLSVVASVVDCVVVSVVVVSVEELVVWAEEMLSITAW